MPYMPILRVRAGPRFISGVVYVLPAFAKGGSLRAYSRITA
jgi:hypothetical protein